jgi:tetratricopeptide (TPR) repeat protein
MAELIQIVSLENEIEGTLMEEILRDRKIPFTLRRYHDMAFDGVTEGWQGWGMIESYAEYRNEILEIYNDVIQKKEKTASAPETQGIRKYKRLIAFVAAGILAVVAIVIVLFLIFSANDEALAQRRKKSAPYWRDGNLYYQSKEYEKAIEQFTKGLEIYDDDAYGFALRGRAYYHQGKYEQALPDIDKAIQLNPNEYAFYELRGLIYRHKNDFEKAIESLSRAIALNDQAAESFYERGYAYYRLKKYDPALADQDRAITLKPDDPRYFNDRGKTYLAFKEYQKALADQTQAIAFEPTESLYYYNRARTYFAMKEYQKAIESFTQAIDLNKTDAVSTTWRGMSYSMLQKYDPALAELDKGIALDPQNDLGYYEKGMIFMYQHKYDLAQTNLLHALELNSRYINIYLGLGRLAVLLRQPQDAINYFEQARKINEYDFVADYFIMIPAFHLSKDTLALKKGELEANKERIIADTKNVNENTIAGDIIDNLDGRLSDADLLKKHENKRDELIRVYFYLGFNSLFRDHRAQARAYLQQYLAMNDSERPSYMELARFELENMGN